MVRQGEVEKWLQRAGTLTRMKSDKFSKNQRSWLMSRVQSKGNKNTELRLLILLQANGISGWRRHLPLPGRPDFSFRQQKVAVFVDGCFWHGCPRCFRLPKQNRAFWKAKIEGNRRRDRSVDARLKRLGWRVARIRECGLKHENKVLDKIKKTL